MECSISRQTQHALTVVTHVHVVRVIARLGQSCTRQCHTKWAQRHTLVSGRASVLSTRRPTPRAFNPPSRADLLAQGRRPAWHPPLAFSRRPMPRPPSSSCAAAPTRSLAQGAPRAPAPVSAPARQSCCVRWPTGRWCGWSRGCAPRWPSSPPRSRSPLAARRRRAQQPVLSLRGPTLTSGQRRGSPHRSHGSRRSSGSRRPFGSLAPRSAGSPQQEACSRS
jgi:hypothetical protein